MTKYAYDKAFTCRRSYSNLHIVSVRKRDVFNAAIKSFVTFSLITMKVPIMGILI